MPVMRVREGVKLQPRDPNDFYPTAPAVARSAIELALNLRTFPDPIRMVDPGAGTGVWGEAAAGYFEKPQIVGVEYRKVKPNPVYTDWITGDFRLVTPSPAHFLLGNPPFKYAESFVRCSVEYVLPLNGAIMFLLPLNFLAGETRRLGLWHEYPINDVFVLSRRPSFIHKGAKKGNTDATEYAFFWWDFSRPKQESPIIHWHSWLSRSPRRKRAS